MRRLATATATAALAATMLAWPTPALANTDCATRAEWQQVREGMRLIRVERVVGAPGRVVLRERLPDGTRGLWVEFRRCRGGTAGAGFDNFNTGRSAGDPWYSFEPFVRVATKTAWSQP